MGLRINTNIQSLSAQRSLGSVKQEQGKALERLSSGDRINKAADDAAGLAISEKLKAKIRGSRQATRNGNDGISMIQVAEGGLNEVSNILIRLRELSVQASSDTLGDNERGFANNEFQELTKEIDRISQSTTFNGRNLLNGEGEAMDIQVGTSNTENNRISYDPGMTDTTTGNLGISGLEIESKESAQDNLEAIDSALDGVNSNRANLGAVQSRLESTVQNLSYQTENLSEANSRIRDADIAAQSSELARTNILSSANTSVLAQANTSHNSALKLVG